MGQGKAKILSFKRGDGGKKSANKKVKSSQFDYGWLLIIIVAILFIFLVATNPDPYLRILLFVRDGIVVTISVTAISFFLTIFVGLIGGLGRSSKNKVIFGIASLYVELVRGIPLLVQLIWWYFAFPIVLKSIGESLGIQALVNFRANPIAMAVIGLTVCYGAYMSEIVRAGIQSVPVGQTEAARSVGMTYFQSMRFIVLPQAIRVILPPIGNEFVAMLKDSALVSVVAVADLTRRGREFMSYNFNPIEVWTLVALIYLLMTLFSSRMVVWLEKKSETSV
jgi:polar amino acid transport system permease protein